MRIGVTCGSMPRVCVCSCWGASAHSRACFSPELKSADSVAWLAALAPTRHCPAYPALAGQALRNAFTAVIGNIGSKMSDILGSHESAHCNRTKPVNTRPPLRRNSPKAITNGISVPFLCSPGRGTPSQEMWRWPVSTYRLRACS
jgi:hypothetical protein